MGKWGLRSKWPRPLKIFNNGVKKLIPKLGNLKNFRKLSKKCYLTKTFDFISVSRLKVAKSWINFENLSFVNKRSLHDNRYHFGKYLVYTFNWKMIEFGILSLIILIQKLMTSSNFSNLKFKIYHPCWYKVDVKKLTYYHVNIHSYANSIFEPNLYRIDHDREMMTS